MSDQERSDYAVSIQDKPPPSLPPNQKLAKDVWGDVFWLLTLSIGLLAAKWAVITGGEFGTLLMVVVSIKASLSTGKGVSSDAIQQYLRR